MGGRNALQYPAQKQSLRYSLSNGIRSGVKETKVLIRYFLVANLYKVRLLDHGP